MHTPARARARTHAGREADNGQSGQGVLDDVRAAGAGNRLSLAQAVVVVGALGAGSAGGSARAVSATRGPGPKTHSRKQEGCGKHFEGRCCGCFGWVELGER